jgi:hypothetical protein
VTVGGGFFINFILREKYMNIITLEEATKAISNDLISYALEKELNGDVREINHKFIKQCLIFLSTQTNSVPIGALIGHLVGSNQDKIYNALEFLEALIELDYIDIKQVNGNWIVDPIEIYHEVDRELGIDENPFRKTERDAFCGKLIHSPKATRVDHLTFLGHIRFVLNRTFLEAFPEIPEEAPYRKTLPFLLNAIDGVIYSNHKYDTRGRTYAAGHVNYQGTEWEKCLLEFAKRERLNDQGIENLKLYMDGLKDKEIYLKFVAEQALQERNTGIFVGADASASGMQIIATLYGCTKTATNVGLLDKRNDAYTVASNKVDFTLPEGVDTRDIFKQCCMQHSYGGTKTPLELLGEDNYENFIDTMWKLFPAVQEYLSIIQRIYYRTPVFSWTLPDGFEVHQPVIETKKERFHLPHDEEVVFGYAYKTLVEKDTGLEMAANVVHSIDGYVARELIFRAAQGCNFIHHKFKYNLETAIKKSVKLKNSSVFSLHKLLKTPTTHWSLLGTEFLTKAQEYVNRIEELDLRAFTVISIHDDFKSHPNYLHYVKWLYLEILADIADSTLLKDIVEEINPSITLRMPKTGNSFAKQLREARKNDTAKGLT